MTIILISGGTGVGTTSIASALAKDRNIQYVVGTDAIREAARQLVNPAINPYLHLSTYLAGRTSGYNTKTDDVKKEKIVRAFKTQTSVVRVCIDGIIKRYLKEESPLIIEGINLLPGDYSDFLDSDLVKQILVDIPDEQLHFARIKERTDRQPQRGNDYLGNFKEIRWLRDYLVNRANQRGIPIIHNTDSLESTLSKINSLI